MVACASNCIIHILGIVDKSNWLPYSVQAENRVKTSTLMKTSAFRNGLAQLKNLRDKIENSNVTISSSGIDFAPDLGTRSLRKLDKEHLQKEDEENIRNLEKKMRKNIETGQYECLDCNWVGKVQHKAKAHARSCGQRKKVIKRRAVTDKFECSYKDCSESFSKQKNLSNHYR